MEQPFQIVYVVRLVPGPLGYREETDLQVHLWPGFLEAVSQIKPQERPRAVMVHLALILNARPLEGEELEEFEELGLATKADQGQLVSGMTNVDIERVTGISRKIVPRLCRELERLGWLSARKLDGEVRRRLGRFAGDRIYLVRAGSEILYTSPEAGSGLLPEEQATCSAPCPPRGHGGRQEMSSLGKISPTVSSTGTRSVPTADTVCPLEGHGEADMERENGENGKVEITSPATIVSASSIPTSLSEEPISQEPSSSTHLAAVMMTVLDHVDRRLAEQWPNGEGDGQPASLFGYEAARAILQALPSPLSLATVSAEVPTDLVENLTVLACSLRSHGLASLLEAVEYALGQAGEVPVLRLGDIWPHVPGAALLSLELRQMLRQGGRLPQGGGFRHARQLFILLNRFELGIGLLRRFLGLCRKLEVRPVHVVLKRALREGRGYVTLPFLQDGVTRWHEEQLGRRPTQELPGDRAGPVDGVGGGDQAPPPADSAGRQGAASSNLGSASLRERLSEYGITEPALGELSTMDPAPVRGWMLYLDGQSRLTAEERCAILISRLRDGYDPPAEYLGLTQMTPDQEAWLEAGYYERRMLGQWPDGLEETGLTLTVANQWYRARRASDQD